MPGIETSKPYRRKETICHQNWQDPTLRRRWFWRLASLPLLACVLPSGAQSAAKGATATGFTPFILGFGFFLLAVVGIGGGLVASTSRPADVLVTLWVARSIAMGLALVVVGFASFTMMIGRLPGGPRWWALSIAAIPISQVLLVWNGCVRPVAAPGRVHV